MNCRRWKRRSYRKSPLCLISAASKRIAARGLGSDRAFVLSGPVDQRHARRGPGRPNQLDRDGRRIALVDPVGARARQLRALLWRRRVEDQCFTARGGRRFDGGRPEQARLRAPRRRHVPDRRTVSPSTCRATSATRSCSCGCRGGLSSAVTPISNIVQPACSKATTPRDPAPQHPVEHRPGGARPARRAARIGALGHRPSAGAAMAPKSIHLDDVSWRVRSALAYIEMNLAEGSLTADRVARAQGVSRRRLDQILRGALGVSVTAHIWNRRLEQAAADLIDPRCNGQTVSPDRLRNRLRGRRPLLARLQGPLRTRAPRLAGAGTGQVH